MSKASKLAQRNVLVKGHYVSVGLVGDIGYIEITDNNIYQEGDSRFDRREQNFNTMMIPLMTREQLKELKVAIKEVLKNSK
jgi:hypothetical protein